MKSLIIFFTLFVSTIVLTKAQNLPVDAKTGKITYLEVVDAAGLTAQDIFKIAKDWGISKGYKIKKEDEATGEIIFDAKIAVEYAGVPGKAKTENGNVNFTYSVFCKEGKFRYIATDFVHAGLNGAASGGKLESTLPTCGVAGMTAASWQFIKKKTQSNMDVINADLKRVVKEVQNDPAKNSDW